MARDDTQWDDDVGQYSSRESDDSPLLYRHDRSRLVREKADRRWPVTIIAKFSLFSTAMILFCVFMYIPVYNRANDQMPKVAVAGWSVHTNRDTKIYVQPNNVTTIHEPIYICPKKNREKLFLLIVVCSSTTNFERRVAIRETWGNSTNFVESAKIFHAVHEKFKNYNYSYDLYAEMNYTDRRRRDVEAEEGVSVTESVGNKSTNDFELKDEVGLDKTDSAVIDTATVFPLLEDKDSVNQEELQRTVITTKNIHRKRDLTSFNRILPELAKALSVTMTTDDKMLPEFDMNKEIGGQENEVDYNNYDYDTNIMKIPPRGEENFDLENVIAKIKENYPKSDVNFKVVFLLGLPANDNSSEVQDKIDEEVDKYGDIIQEGFIDSYNNLTLKSIMMLKWVTNNCGDSVRYILKTDDDMYINVPNLMTNLQNRSKIHDQTKEKEYLLIGDLICGARPVLDTSNKWYSPRYMYSGRVYPRYLSGTGYVLSTPTAHALYQAALRTHYFHLEDIFITGMCSLRASPRITPRDEPGFSYNGGGGACAVHSKLTAHRVTPYRMKRVAMLLRDLGYVDRCERLRLTQIKTHRESRMFIIYKYLRLVVGGRC
ncbi:uncharacterized protein LOC125062222 [Pieris napi]|uniref:uncharacterized protein LOC125062222 n=1 Tax=Pieris napi TaxID=78633 RepID=UPI001FBB7ABD|nr:uncharacterized protein LOC125062222 [Pieris napi]